MNEVARVRCIVRYGFPADVVHGLVELRAAQGDVFDQLPRSAGEGYRVTLADIQRLAIFHWHPSDKWFSPGCTERRARWMRAAIFSSAGCGQRSKLPPQMIHQQTHYPRNLRGTWPQGVQALAEKADGLPVGQHLD